MLYFLLLQNNNKNGNFFDKKRSPKNTNDFMSISYKNIHKIKKFAVNFTAKVNDQTSTLSEVD